MAYLSPFLLAQIDKIFENFVIPDEYLQHHWIFVSDNYAFPMGSVITHSQREAYMDLVENSGGRQKNRLIKTNIPGDL